MNESRPIVLMAGAAVSPLVQELGLCLVAAALVSVVFEKLRIPAVAALLAAGVLLGPVGLGLVHDRSDIETIANLGLTLLLFVIGLEVNLRSLLGGGRTLVVSGLVQVPATVGAALGAFLGLRALGVAGFEGRYVPLYLAMACGFSSTLLVVKLLQARRRLDTAVGRFAVALLIFQDVWAIIVLAMQPSFESPAVLPVVLTFGGIAVVTGVAVVAARTVLPAAFRVVAHVPELMVTAALGWCFGLGLFGSHLGDALKLAGVDIPVSVSLEMGALIAGASIATFPYHHEVVAKVSNLRDFFVTLFFVGLGMGIPLPSSASILMLAGLVAFIAVAVRLLVFFPIFYFTGMARGTALEASSKLAQVSEFCLVMTYLGQKHGHLDANVVSIVIFAFVITALLTPALFTLSDRLDSVLGPLLGALGFKAPTERRSKTELSDAPRLVILGLHRVTSALLHDLLRDDPQLAPHVVVVDMNVTTHDALRALGVKVLYGDIGETEVLRHAHIERASVVISSVPDELLQRTSNEAIVRNVRALAPEAVVIASATRPSDVARLTAAGATHAFVPSQEVAAALAPVVRAAWNDEIEAHLTGQRLTQPPPDRRYDVMY